MRDPIPTIEWLVDAAPGIIGMLPVAAAPEIAAVVTAAGALLRAAAAQAEANGFDAKSAIAAADAASELALALKFAGKP